MSEKGWVFNPPGKFCSPEEFAGKYVQFRKRSKEIFTQSYDWHRQRLTPGELRHRFSPDEMFAAISPGGLRNLVSLAFYASFQQDEGRYPRLNLYVPGKPTVSSTIRTLCEFTKPVPLDAPAIRHLSPALISPN